MNQEIPSKYINQLEEILSIVKEKISTSLTSDFKIKEVNYDEIDNYVTELNSYYYKSFHEHFFPNYKNAIVAEIKELLQIKHDQSLIEKDLISNIKRYAKLYNQVKVVNHLLSNTREDFNNSLYTVYREKQQQTTELSFSLKSLHQALISLHNTTNLLTKLYEDKDLLDAVKFFPDMPRILSKTSKLAPSEINVIKRLVIRLQIISNLVSQLQDSNNTKKVVTSILKDLNIQISSINSDGTWTSMPKPFVDNFNLRFKAFLELVNSYNELNKLDMIRKTADDYDNLIYSFVTIIEKGLDFLQQNNSRISEDLFSNVFNIMDLSKNSLLIMNQNISEVKGALDRIYEDILNAGQPDFSYFAKTLEQILNNYQVKFQQLLQHEDIMQITPLAKQLNLVSLEFSILDRHLHLLKEKYNFSMMLENRYLELINILDYYLSFISNTRGDLERILATRNLNRIWKGFNVKVERIPVEVGKKLAINIDDIIKDSSIKRVVCDMETDVVLEEEGDIFIISINDMTVYEIPPLTLAQKG